MPKPDSRISSHGKDLKVREAGRAIQEKMADIADLFTHGYKITVVCRNPEFPDGSRDMVLTDDNWDAIVAALMVRRRAEGNPHPLAPDTESTQTEGRGS